MLPAAGSAVGWTGGEEGFLPSGLGAGRDLGVRLLPPDVGCISIIIILFGFFESGFCLVPLAGLELSKIPESLLFQPPEF